MKTAAIYARDLGQARKEENTIASQTAALTASPPSKLCCSHRMDIRRRGL